MQPDNHNENISLLVKRGIAIDKTTDEVKRASEIDEYLALKIKRISALANYRKPKVSVECTKLS